MKLPIEYERLLESVGIPLGMPGTQDIALSRQHALLGIRLLRSAAIPVLGGDVFFCEKGSVKLAYANWSSNKRLDESLISFCERSCTEAQRYISEFSAEKNNEPLFVLVPG